MSSGDVLLEVESLSKSFAVKQGVFSRGMAQVRAVDRVNLAVERGKTLGIVGESGCGKSTTARLMLRLLDPTAGTVRFEGQDITHIPQRRLHDIRREMRMVFQDPYSSLNPRKTVAQILREPYLIHGEKDHLKRRVDELVARVGLSPEHANRYPHEFSGGQRQRVGIARALALDPKLIVCDEPVSALDVSIQAQILNLLRSLQDELNLTYVFISHDLSVIRQIADRVAVMYLGRVVEVADVEDIFERPQHPYTAALLSAVPRASAEGAPEREQIFLSGDVPSPIDPPSGCHFHPRCPRFHAGRCDGEVPALAPEGAARAVACHFPLERWPMTEAEIRAGGTPRA